MRPTKNMLTDLAGMQLADTEPTLTAHKLPALELSQPHLWSNQAPSSRRQPPLAVDKAAVDAQFQSQNPSL